ncbi:MAG: hypothetical protein ACJAZO_002282 [Myxococcota bacterium]|jgi:hypothetical protein
MSKSLTFLDAAAKLLNEAGEPLHYREITKRGLEAGFLQISGKTPADTLNAQLWIKS